MAEGRDRAAWQHTSAVLAMMANANRDAKKHPRPFVPADFDPYARGRPKPRRPKRAASKSELSEAKAILEGMRKQTNGQH
ncbi:MAG: hypothetical protein IMZ55_07410 [Acidobacteria bacterium]|nr:hypothetical protein [Acidobacteriota bacterium]